MALLEVDNLQTHFGTPDGVVRAVDGVSFDVEAGETLGIVGESGCGKSTTARLLLGLIEADGGTLRFEDQDLRQRRGGSAKPLRKQLQMVFQNPHAALNPRMSIGENVAFPLKV